MSEITRLNIFDSIRVGWSGRLSEVDFLSRLYDLESLPSYDHRFLIAKADIVQHREVNPDDWPEDWIFEDSRFDLIHASDEAFIRFLCEMAHPVVRPDSHDAENLVKMLNQHLVADGWEIVAKTHVSGRPVFAARRCIVKNSPALRAAKSISKVLNADYITQQITRMEAAVESDPELAIGTAKEFVETVCKTILHDCGEKNANCIDLPQLVKQVREKLDLLPEDVPEKAKGAEIIKRILGNLGTMVQGLAELRNYYGSGHGKHGKAKGLKPRHAKLAVGAASTLAVFLFETHKERKE
ncbi:MAG: abortive infection family protein [Deltaproteobacteria bacterium]|nr:abortive infection family protein [Deltaproteobacteria bacterium]